MWGALKNLGGSNNPKHVRAMAEAEAKCAAMGIKADHSSELGLAELAMMASAAYDLHDHETVREENEDYAKLMRLGWRLDYVERQPKYAVEYPEKLAMAVFVKGGMAVIALKGTTPAAASDLHLDLASIVGGVPPCGPLEEAAVEVKKYQGQKKRVMVTGHSLGGYMAEVVATNLQIGGVGFCAPGSGWHGGKKHSGFQNINFKHDPMGNILAGIYEHPQWSVYVEDTRKPIHSMAYMVKCMENPGRTGWTNQNVVSRCKSSWTGYYTKCNTPK